MTEEHELRPPSAAENEWLESLPAELDEAFLKRLTLRQLILLERADLTEKQQEALDVHTAELRRKMAAAVRPGMRQIRDSIAKLTPRLRSTPPQPLLKPFDHRKWSEDVARQTAESVEQVRAANRAEVERQEAMVEALQGVHHELLNQGAEGRHARSVEHAVLVLSALALVAAVAVPVATATGSVWWTVLAIGVGMLVPTVVSWLLGVFRSRT